MKILKYCFIFLTLIIFTSGCTDKNANSTVDFGNSTFSIKYAASQGEAALNEYTKDDESIHEWSEMIAVEAYNVNANDLFAEIVKSATSKNQKILIKDDKNNKTISIAIISPDFKYFEYNVSKIISIDDSHTKILRFAKKYPFRNKEEYLIVGKQIFYDNGRYTKILLETQAPEIVKVKGEKYYKTSNKTKKEKIKTKIKANDLPRKINFQTKNEPATKKTIKFDKTEFYIRHTDFDEVLATNDYTKEDEAFNNYQELITINTYRVIAFDKIFNNYAEIVKKNMNVLDIDNENKIISHISNFPRDNYAEYSIVKMRKVNDRLTFTMTYSKKYYYNINGKTYQEQIKKIKEDNPKYTNILIKTKFPDTILMKKKTYL